MPKFKVDIDEQIIESRTYEIEADSAKEAAKAARQLWINQGKNPKDGPSIEIEERWYSAKAINAAGDIVGEIEEFDDREMED